MRCATRQQPCDRCPEGRRLLRLPLHRRTHLPGAQPKPRHAGRTPAQEADQERQRIEGEQATAKAQHQFLKSQKRLPLTLGEVEGRQLPTLAGVYQTLLELGCEITATDGTLQITVPRRLRENDNEDLAARQAVHEAAHLLDYCRDLVATHLQANQELPSGPITVGGGVAR